MLMSRLRNPAGPSPKYGNWDKYGAGVSAGAGGAGAGAPGESTASTPASTAEKAVPRAAAFKSFGMILPAIPGAGAGSGRVAGAARQEVKVVESPRLRIRHCKK